MNKLQAGFARLDIMPALGTPIDGYFFARNVEGSLDTLEVNALALRVEQTTTLFLSLDLCLIATAECDKLRRSIAEATAVPFEAIFLHTTHTHTGVQVGLKNLDGGQQTPQEQELLKKYADLLCRKATEVAKLALADCKSAKMGWAVGNASKVAFIRRFRMKDGKIRTNPGVGNPDIVHPIGEADERVNVLRFDRERDTLVLVNFGNHPDTVGGCKVSGDWPGFMRRRLEKALDNVKCIFFNGAQGDINHIDVNAKGGDLNDLHDDFDAPRGYGHARHIGNVVAGSVLQVFDKVNYEDVESLKYLQKFAEIPSNMPNPEELPLARKYNALHEAGKDEEIPFEGMELTTVVAEAGRMLALENGPESFRLELGGVALGNIAMITIPGEPFTGIGRGLKEAEGWTMVMPMALTNGYEGYFPMKEAYDEGGYEARSSRYKAGCAERMIAEGKELLQKLRENAV